MSTVRVTRKKLPDPLQPQIDRVLATKIAAEQRLAAGRPIAAAETLRDLAAYMRQNPIAPQSAEVWP